MLDMTHGLAYGRLNHRLNTHFVFLSILTLLYRYRTLAKELLIKNYSYKTNPFKMTVVLETEVVVVSMSIISYRYRNIIVNQFR